MKFKSTLCLIALLFATFVLFMQSNIAFAQSNSCNKLTQTLRSLDRNRDYRSYQRNKENYQRASKELKEQESLFVRGGCQKQLNSGQKLSSQCKTLARRILKNRPKVEKLKNSLGTGQMVAEQRKQILQQIASRNCNNNSRSTVTLNSPSSLRNNQPARSLFDILFGGRNVEIRADDEFGMLDGYKTVRTVCARSCDGYFWPISFSTTEEYLPDDARQCQAEGKGADVSLYYYKNPGERAEDMISISGRPYSSSPNAFRYRNEYDGTCSIKREINYGSIKLLQAKDGEQSRIMVSFKDISFPMPIIDPRHIQEVIVAKTISITLPRPRPLRDGEEAPKVQISTAPTNHQALRTYKQNGKVIRIVGPDTPYAQLGAEGT